MITRIVLAFEAGRDGFWLARWLRARSIEPFVIHSTSVAVSREHRRAKTDRLDTEMLIRVFLGWLRGEPRHCKMVAIPTLEEEDARRPSRDCSRRRSALKHSIQRRAYQSHQTCLMNCGAIWRDWLGSASRSMQSSRLGLNAWNRRRALARMQWCGCWQALSVLVSRQRICWCRRSCRETFEIDGP